MATVARSNTKKRRGRGGCCGCLILLVLILGGGLWLARKWAPNHLNHGLAWSRIQLVKKYPVLDRWVPQAPNTAPASVFEPPTPAASPSPSPAAVATPAPSPIPTEALPSGPAVDLVVGSGAEAKLGQTVSVRYSGNKPAEAPELLMLGASDVDPALDTAIRGMKVGGKRRVGAVEVELVKVL